jgi:hypothetical protein
VLNSTTRRTEIIRADSVLRSCVVWEVVCASENKPSDRDRLQSLVIGKFRTGWDGRRQFRFAGNLWRIADSQEFGDNGSLSEWVDL